MANINYEALKEQLLAQCIALNFCVVNESNQNSQDFYYEHFGTGTAPPVAMSEGQVWNKESFECGQSLEAYNIHLSRNVREIVCEPKPCSFHFIHFAILYTGQVSNSYIFDFQTALFTKK